MSLNHIDLMGRLVRNPEIRQTASGVSVANFTLAVDRDYTKQGEDRQCDFIDCQAWRGTADFVCNYFLKGQMMALSGRLQINDWTDKDGNKRRNAVVVADNVYFGEPKRNRDNAPSEDAPAEKPDFVPVNVDDGELPF